MVANVVALSGGFAPSAHANCDIFARFWWLPALTSISDSHPLILSTSLPSARAFVLVD